MDWHYTYTHATPEETSEKLRIAFANFAMPEQIVMANNSSFTNFEFETFP